MPMGLIRRGASYAIRRVIPKDLKAHFGREVDVKTLGTTDFAEAKRRLVKRWAEYDDLFAKARAELATAPVAIPSSATPQAQRTPHPWEALDRASFEFEIAQLEAQARDAAQEEDEFDAREGLRNQIETRLAGSPSDLTAEELATQDIIKHHAFKAQVAQLQADYARSSARQQDTGPALSPPNVTDGLDTTQRRTTLAAVVDSWIAERKPKSRTVVRTRNIVARFEAVAGALPVEAVTKHHVLAFKEKLLQDGQSPANINVMIPMLGTVFIHASDKMHLIQTNPAAKIRVTDKRRAKEKRRAFELSELQAIFTSAVYSNDLRPSAGGGEASYWLPLLSLYSGARQTELGQLHPDDVVEETYHDTQDQARTAWVVRIVENAARGQAVKNEGSERRIPVHLDLIELGFLRFVDEAKAAHRERLFPDIVPNAGGELMGNWSKWFGRYRRRECGLTALDTPFHSFRHTFKHYARLASIPKEVHNEITGHETGDVADAYGGMSYPLLPLVEGMKKYRVPGLTLPAAPPGLR